jgi:hypothetical protein
VLDSTPANLRAALGEIIDGRIVKRIRHDLVYEGENLAPVFIVELEKRGYRQTTVGKVDVQPGERVPAFYIKDDVAYFGWVFWEQFTTWKSRKLWGSVIKDTRGDWEIQIPASRTTPIYANDSLTLEMDIDHPPEF